MVSVEVLRLEVEVVGKADQVKWLGELAHSSKYIYRLSLSIPTVYLPTGFWIGFDTVVGVSVTVWDVVFLKHSGKVSTSQKHFFETTKSLLLTLHMTIVTVWLYEYII